jgi:hypothetical protein
MSQCLTGKTIGELSTLSGLSGNTLFIVEQDGVTYNIPFSAFGIDVNSCLTDTLTYSQMTGKTSTNSLKPGCFYMITDADPTLYGGTNIVIQAITNNQLALQGHGLFYTPLYDQSIAGFGIWYTGGTYGIGDDVFWGGYVWENLTGSVGSSTDLYNLDNTNWSAKTYNYSGYNTSIDVIHYDYDNNLIIYRKDKLNNEVSITKNFNDIIFLEWVQYPIKSFQWGNGSNEFVSNNSIANSLFDCINFRGSFLNYNTLKNLSLIVDTDWGENYSEFSYNTLDSSSFQYNTLDNYSSFSFNTLDNGSSFLSNTLDNGSSFGYNTLDSSSFQSNTLDNGSSFLSNTLNNNSYFSSNTLNNNSNFQSNTLDDGSSFLSNTLDSSSFQSNFLTNGSTSNVNTLNNGSTISNNTLNNNSSINSDDLDSNSLIFGNTLTYSSINFNVLNNGTINYNILTKPTPFD